jgi:hypothetical protein
MAASWAAGPCARVIVMVVGARAQEAPYTATQHTWPPERDAARRLARQAATMLACSEAARVVCMARAGSKRPGGAVAVEAAAAAASVISVAAVAAAGTTPTMRNGHVGIDEAVKRTKIMTGMPGGWLWVGCHRRRAG